MDPVSRSFDRTPIPINRDRGTNHTKIKGSCQEMAKENFIPGEEEVNWNQNPHATPISSISLKSKTPDLLIKFKWLRKSSPIFKSTFQGDQRNFSSSRKVEIFFEKHGKSYKRLNNPIQNYTRFRKYLYHRRWKKY